MRKVLKNGITKSVRDRMMVRSWQKIEKEHTSFIWYGVWNLVRLKIVAVVGDQVCTQIRDHIWQETINSVWKIRKEKLNENSQ